MGELIRRLDYIRRSKHKFHLADSQRINREYSTPVRAANAMEDRKKDLYIKKTEMHTRLFLNRYEYEKKVVEHFKEDLDVKSQDFNEEKFQLLRRARSAMSRLQSAGPGWSGPVVEIVPREYYRSDTRATEVKFKDADMTEEPDDSEDTGGEETHDGRPDSSTILRGAPLSLKVKMTSKNSIQFLRRRRISIAYTTDKPLEFDLKSLPARRARRKSAPPRMTAYIPPDPSPSRPGSRRGSRSSLGSVSEEGETSDTNDSATTRSYRVLREAFKKQRKERHDPSKERFNAIKNDHLKRDELLRGITLLRFDKIFEGHASNIY